MIFAHDEMFLVAKLGSTSIFRCISILFHSSINNFINLSILVTKVTYDGPFDGLTQDLPQTLRLIAICNHLSSQLLKSGGRKNYGTRTATIAV